MCVQRDFSIGSHLVLLCTVLPKALRDRVVSELDKRLDFDFDEFLSSPKLRLKLSPAELDRSLLEFYDTVSESPSGDLLRLIGGGGAVGLQNMYMRQQAQKELLRKGSVPTFLPPPLDLSESEDRDRTPSQWVRRVMQKNRPAANSAKARASREDDGHKAVRHGGLKMHCTSLSPTPLRGPTEWSGMRSPRQPAPRSRANTLSASLLI